MTKNRNNIKQLIANNHIDIAIVNLFKILDKYLDFENDKIIQKKIR